MPDDRGFLNEPDFRDLVLELTVLLNGLSWMQIEHVLTTVRKVAGTSTRLDVTGPAYEAFVRGYFTHGANDDTKPWPPRQ